MKNQMQSHRCGDLGYGSQAAPMALHRIILVVLRDAGAAFDSILVDQSGPSQPNLQRHGEGDMSPMRFYIAASEDCISAIPGSLGLLHKKSHHIIVRFRLGLDLGGATDARPGGRNLRV